jgi:hypothetical protein
MPAATNCPRPVKGRGFFNPQTGEVRRIPCSSWSCPVCGPAKAYRLGLLAAYARPDRFITLSRAGTTPPEAFRRLKTLCKSLRRARKGIEYLAVVERHQNGFWHLHVLQRGDFIPQRELSARASSAGMGSVVWIERVGGDPHQVAKYLVKYVTKDAGDLPKGTRRYATSRGFWPNGKASVEAMAFGAPRRASEDRSWEVLRIPKDWSE